MAVKIIIKRHVPKHRETKILPLLIELRAKATAQPGYISGETLRNVDKAEEYVVISTWQSSDAWKAWQANPEREEITGRLKSLLDKETEYGAYYYG